MSRARTPSLSNDYTDTEDFSCADSIVSANTGFQTDITSPSPSPRRRSLGSGAGMPNESDLSQVSPHPEKTTSEGKDIIMYGGVHVQDDVVGQYLARRDAQRASIEALQAPTPHYVSEPAGYPIQGYQSGLSYESHANGSAQRWYPDPEAIRHLHALHSLLPHISPERKLNALSGPKIDVIDGTTSQVLYSAAPKKLLVLFLGREVINKFIRTFAREDSKAWRGLPTEQKLVLPSRATSAAALKILISWMARACSFATMHDMKPLRIPNNLFVACSLATTLEMFRLYRDAYRLDVAITQQLLSRRPIFAVEIETIWICLGENDKYVYACIRALSQRMSEPGVGDDLQGLAERVPALYARLSSFELNELYRPKFGREWFERMDDWSNDISQDERGRRADGDVAVRPILSLNHRPSLEETSKQPTLGIALLNPSASPFIPMR